MGIFPSWAIWAFMFSTAMTERITWDVGFLASSGTVTPNAIARPGSVGLTPDVAQRSK